MQPWLQRRSCVRRWTSPSTAESSGARVAKDDEEVAIMGHHDYDDEYAGDQSPPWEIGGPQPALEVLLGTIEVVSPVLDVGCGTGDLAIFLAEQGHRVLGIDASAPGIERARAKSAGRDLDLDLDFQVLNATRLEEIDVRPRTVVDSGLLHNLDAEDQVEYVNGLQSICDTGARVCILAASWNDDMGWGVAPETFGQLFATDAWEGTEIRQAEVQAREDFRLPGHTMTTTRV